MNRMREWFAKQNKVMQNVIQLILMLLIFAIGTIAVGIIRNGGAK